MGGPGRGGHFTAVAGCWLTELAGPQYQHPSGFEFQSPDRKIQSAGI